MCFVYVYVYYLATTTMWECKSNWLALKVASNGRGEGGALLLFANSAQILDLTLFI